MLVIVRVLDYQEICGVPNGTEQWFSPLELESTLVWIVLIFSAPLTAWQDLPLG